MIRVFNSTKNNLQTENGIMTGKEDGTSLIQYLTQLCRNLNGILLAEPKVIMLNGPAIVMGDIQGNLSNLISFEETTFPSFPVMPENLIFLGNYTGEYPFGVECLIYLFAMKITAPNKVFLLRGHAETRVQSSNFQAKTCLKNECFNKYGREKGYKIYELLNDIFTKLPLVIVLNESIICVHSGIPKMNTKLMKDIKLPEQIFDPQRDSPISHEVSFL